MSVRLRRGKVAKFEGLPVGWEVVRERRNALGFAAAVESRQAGRISDRLLTHRDDGHILTVGPTGSGKGRSCVVPALLTYPGPVLVIDVKAENYHVVARRRREMGHKVVVIDPFGCTGEPTDGLNPFDLLTLDGGEPDCDGPMITELLTGGQAMLSKDPFWDITGKGLITGLIGLACEDADPEKRNPSRLLDLLYADDVDYSIAVQLDTHKFATELFRRELAAYLNHESDKCRPSVRSTAQTFVQALGSRRIQDCLRQTTFDLDAWVDGEPMDIFIIFPPDKLDSHRAVLRLLLSSLFSLLMRRQAMPEERTLLLLDECAQLGSLPLLKTALTLLRGYGVLVWSLWQDLSQLKNLYPLDWETVLNNSSVVQVFGMNNGWMAKTCAEVLGVTVDRLLKLKPDEQMLMVPGEGTRLTRRVDYLNDRVFAGLFDENPRYRRASRPRPKRAVPALAVS